MEFNSDGSLRVPETTNEDIELFAEETPSQAILQLLSELRFPIGKKLFSNTITGKTDAKIRKLSLDTCGNFGALDLFDPQDVYNLLDEMIFDGLIQITKTAKTKYFPVLEMTSKGKRELEHPSTTIAKDFVRTHDILSALSKITDEDKQLFTAFGDYLTGFNDAQKKAIIDAAQNILCIAGAGSGKTTVLTKRIDFLIRMRGVDPSKILAITFTRKARQEMLNRLPNIPVKIETFNSFCEKMLKEHGDKFYSKDVIVMNFTNKLKVFNKALSRLSYGTESAIEKYFPTTRGRDEKSLYFTFVNDIYGLIDHYKNNQTPISKFKNIIANCNFKEKQRATFVYNVLEQVVELKEELGFRDYTDQLVHSLELLSKHPELIPQYDYILVDEYQDVNDIQVKLLEVLQPKNLFVVGDPRQSIYGWRGSKIKHIMKFPEEHESCSVVQLTTNYRSSEAIVNVGNAIIKPMHLPNLSSFKKESLPEINDNNNKKPLLLKHKDEASELKFVAQSILACDVPYNEIFVLARTNKQLEKIKEVLQNHEIGFLIRTTEDQKQNVNPTDKQITLSTVHAIKGLEAKLVYLIGTTSKMYPCLVSDHPIIDMAKLDTSYDKEEEELRLLYVAMTRAKEQLVVNYYGSLSKFISGNVKSLFSFVDNTMGTKVGVSGDLMSRLKEWRMSVAKESNLLPYMVLPDRVFTQLIVQKPVSIADLHNISGLGPTKIMHYGNDLLDLIHSMK